MTPQRSSAAIRAGRTDDACFTLLLAIVSIAATLAELIQLEGILGAFLAGLVVYAAVRSSPAYGAPGAGGIRSPPWKPWIVHS